MGWGVVLLALPAFLAVEFLPFFTHLRGPRGPSPDPPPRTLRTAKG